MAMACKCPSFACVLGARKDGGRRKGEEKEVEVEVQEKEKEVAGAQRSQLALLKESTIFGKLN